LSLFYALKGVSDSRNSDNFRKKPSKKKPRTNTKKDAKRIKSDNFTRSNE
jgi:hypothetical protein